MKSQFFNIAQCETYIWSILETDKRHYYPENAFLKGVISFLINTFGRINSIMVNKEIKIKIFKDQTLNILEGFFDKF